MIEERGRDIQLNKKAVVIGATGAVGREIVNELIASDSITEIVTFTRRDIDFGSPKIINYVIDFENLDGVADLVSGEYFFSALGTTKKLAGSINNQRKVDLDYQYEFAKLAQKNGIHNYHLVSSPSADIESSNDYLQMKGELEQKVLSLDFGSVHIYRPSLIKGDRPEGRLLEAMGIGAVEALKWLPGIKKYRPISGKQIARKMVSVALNKRTGHNYYDLDNLFICD